jgi:hypothetical protein
MKYTAKRDWTNHIKGDLIHTLVGIKPKTVGVSLMVREGNEMTYLMQSDTKAICEYPSNCHKPILKRMEDMSAEDLYEMHLLTPNEDVELMNVGYTPKEFHFLISKGYNVFGLSEDEFIDQKTQTNG